MSQTTPETIVIRAEPIELSQLLKFAGVFDSGGEAKFAINAGQVSVNGVVELQARKKILGGQTVVIGERTMVVKLGAPRAPKAKVAPKTVRPRPAGERVQKQAQGQGSEGARKQKPANPVSAGKAPKKAVGSPKATRRDRDDDGYSGEPRSEKPAASAAAQRTFFYTDLLKAQQAKRKKH